MLIQASTLESENLLQGSTTLTLETCSADAMLSGSLQPEPQSSCRRPAHPQRHKTN